MHPLECYRKSYQIVPSFREGHRRAALACLALKDYPAAIDEMEECDKKVGVDPVKVKQRCDELRRAFEAGGESGYWLKRLDQARATLNSDDEPYAFARIYAYLGDKDQAFYWLERAYARHDELIYLIIDECWDPWRDEARFEEIQKKVGLPRHPNFPAR